MSLSRSRRAVRCGKVQRFPRGLGVAMGPGRWVWVLRLRPSCSGRQEWLETSQMTWNYCFQHGGIL